MDTLENTMRKRQLRWYGHVQRNVFSLNYWNKSLRGNQLKEKGKEIAQEKLDRIDTMSKDLKDIKMTWEEVKEVATESTLWRSCF